MTDLPQVDTSRKWFVMAAVSIGVFMATLDGSIVNVALPTLERDLNASFSAVEWVVLAYMLTLVTLMLVVGRLADMFGKKPLYTAGFVLFTLGSGLCGLSTSVYSLIGFRVLQALGSVLMMALGTAIVTEAFPPKERGKALGFTGLMVSLGAISGPTIGGILVGSLSWHWIFWVNLPIGLIGFLMALRYVPNYKPSGGDTFDFFGAASLFIGLFSLLIAVSITQNEGFTTPVALVLFLIFLVFLVIFIRIERKVTHPMIDLSLFSNRLFSVNLVTGFITFVCSAGIVIILPFFLQNVLNYDPRASGFLLGVVPLAMGITAPISGSLSDRFGTRPLTVLGLFILMLGYLGVSTLTENTTWLGYVFTMLPIGVGMGMFQSPNNSAIMGSAPRHRLGVASGLLSITRTLGQTLGISLMAGLWAAITIVVAGADIAGGPTAAPAYIQVQALHTTVLVIVGLIAAAFGLSLWAYLTERKNRVMAQPLPVEIPIQKS